VTSRIRPPKVRLLFPLVLPILAFAQSAPTVGIIDIYGAKKTSHEDIRKALGLPEGAPLSGAKAALEERIEEVEGIVAARVEAACCEDGKVILYVGVQEKGAPTFEYHTPPAEPLSLPEEITGAYTRFVEAVRKAGAAAFPSEDLTRGHSLMSDPAVREIQLSFIPLATDHLEELRAVLRRSDNEEHRAIAAYVIGYAKDKPGIVNDIQYALQDIDDTVRGNAIRALAALSVLAVKDPAAGVKISPTWLIEMLNSVAWTDRNNAAIALVTLTESRDPKVLSLLRERAMSSLIEMARWKHLAHALPPYIILGRVAGVKEKELQDAWSRGQREAIIKRAAASNKR
jgi:hypothetical protein